MKDFFARVRGWWDGLNGRERLLLGCVGALAVALLVWLAGVRPLLDAGAQAATRVSTAERRLETVVRLREQYDQIHSRLSVVEERIRSGPKGEIFTTLESLAREAAVNVDSMEPRTSPASEQYKETKVQVSLKSVTLAQLVNYLNKIESAEQVLSIKSLSIRTRADKPDLLEVTFTVSSFEAA